MSSVTSDFTTINKENSNILNARNALSTVKRKCHRRKIIKISPLRLTDIQKELAEAEEEAHCVEDSESKRDESKNDSFQMNFALTPPPPPPPVPKLGTKNPNTQPALLSQQTNKYTDYDYFTPKNKMPLKVQCSIDIKPLSETPLDKLCKVQSKVARELNVQLEKCVDPIFKHFQVNNVEYIVLNLLGKGGSCEVFHCYNLKAKMHYAIKCVTLQNPSSAVGFINEVKLLKTLQKCSRIIKMFDYEIKEEEKILMVVLEVGGADLSKILKESALNTTHMPVYKLLYYWMEMLYAVKQIHSHGIVHSDLKPANFLEVGGYLKLIDFGIASCIQNDMTSVIKDVPEGSFNYISPEALNNESSSNTNSPSYGKPKYKITYKSDVWSLGCILYQLVYGKTPFQHFTLIWKKFAKLLDPNHKIEYPDAEWVPPKIINTIKKCLQHNVKARPSVEELIEEYENIFHNLL